MSGERGPHIMYSLRFRPVRGGTSIRPGGAATPPGYLACICSSLPASARDRASRGFGSFLVKAGNGWRLSGNVLVTCQCNPLPQMKVNPPVPEWCISVNSCASFIPIFLDDTGKGLRRDFLIPITMLESASFRRLFRRGLWPANPEIRAGQANSNPRSYAVLLHYGAETRTLIAIRCGYSFKPPRLTPPIN